MACPENSYDPAVSFNKRLTYKGVPIPGVAIDLVNKTMTYNLNGRVVTTSFTGYTTYKSVRIPKTYKTASGEDTRDAPNTFTKVGSYIRETTPSGYVIGVQPVISKKVVGVDNSSGRDVDIVKYYIPDGVDRTSAPTARMNYGTYFTPQSQFYSQSVALQKEGGGTGHYEDDFKIHVRKR